MQPNVAANASALPATPVQSFANDSGANRADKYMLSKSDTDHGFMIRLDMALRAWGSPDFETVLKREITQLGPAQLPLQQGLTTGNYATDDPITVVINRVAEMENTFHIRAGIFYRGIISGCSCEDDPTPVSESIEYCEVQLDIDKSTAATAIALVTE